MMGQLELLLVNYNDLPKILKGVMVDVQNKPFWRPIGSFIKKAHKDPIP